MIAFRDDTCWVENTFRGLQGGIARDTPLKANQSLWLLSTGRKISIGRSVIAHLVTSRYLWTVPSLDIAVPKPMEIMSLTNIIKFNYIIFYSNTIKFNYTIFYSNIIKFNYIIF